MNKNQADWIDDFCLMANKYVQSELMVTLDGSPESLAYLDYCIAQSRKKKMPKESVLLASAFVGIYFGKLIVQHTESQWVIPTDLKSENLPFETWIQLDDVPLAICPVQIALSAFEYKEEAPFETLFKIPQHQLLQLEPVLERMAPMTEESYFSLTSRYEFILYLQQILIELKQLNAGETSAKDS